MSVGQSFLIVFFFFCPFLSIFHFGAGWAGLRLVLMLALKWKKPKILLIRHVPREKQQLTDWNWNRNRKWSHDEESPKKRMEWQTSLTHTHTYGIRQMEYGIRKNEIHGRKTGQKQEIKNDSDKPGWLLLSAGEAHKTVYDLRFTAHAGCHLNVLSVLYYYNILDLGSGVLGLWGSKACVCVWLWAWA